MKVFCVITCLLMLVLSQQVVYAQQPSATEPTEKSAEGFVELGMPLEEAFTKITFIVTWLSGDGSNEVIFEGEGVIREKDYIELSEHERSWYRLLSKYAVESNQYIFVPVAEWGGGSGVFYTLHVVDKKTLRTVDEVGLRDRTKIEGITLAVPNSDIVSITYIERDVKSEPWYDPDKAVKRHFRMIGGTLREIGNPFSLPDPDMVFVPAAAFFRMGSDYKDAEDDEKPERTVFVDGFDMDKYEVTNAQYKKFVDANPEWQKDRILRKYHDGDYLKHWNGNNYPPGKDTHPVIYVSWYAAMAYAEWNGKRLPTEAEWEKAARGSSPFDYPWGRSLPDSTKANYGENVGDTTPVGTYDANEYGLYDMAGNVWEWCLDEYNADFYSVSPRHNPVAGGTVDAILSDWTNVKSVRVLRGGSWVSSAKFLRVSDRTRFTPRITNKARGFRCVEPVKP